MEVKIPAGLAANCRRAPETTRWLERLPEVLGTLQVKWQLTFGAPLNGEAALVVLVERGDGADAVLKLGMPHMEAEHEIHGLEFWASDPTVRMLDYDVGLNAMLLERCKPGTPLNVLPEPEQDIVVAALLRRLWREPTGSHPFRPLSTMLSHWRAEALSHIARCPDAALVHEGLRLFEELPQSAPVEALLATDLHAGNVLRAEREPWLVIDPKPFVGDPAYDATQHLFNCANRLRAHPEQTIRRFADLLELDPERVALWTFARAAAAPWAWDDEWLALARALAP